MESFIEIKEQGCGGGEERRRERERCRERKRKKRREVGGVLPFKETRYCLLCTHCEAGHATLWKFSLAPARFVDANSKHMPPCMPTCFTWLVEIELEVPVLVWQTLS